MESPIAKLVRASFEADATDVFLIEGEQARVRMNGSLVPASGNPLTRADLAELWTTCGHDHSQTAEADASWELPGGGGRCRVNLYHTLGRLAAVLRPIRSDVPPLADLGLPNELLESWMIRKNGLILITGPTGSGKSTTVAGCLQWLNQNLARHIVTLEDPIEYLFHNDLALFSQREIRQDSGSFADALRAALRQSPDILFLGEIRDAETALTALHAAETGHLVISTLHSSSVCETLERFSHLLGHGNAGALQLLATQLIGIVSQQLLPRLGGGLFAALEYLQNEAGTRRWILENRLAEIQDHLLKGDGATNCSRLDYLVAAARQGFVDPDIARAACPRPQDFDRAMRGIQ